VRKYVLKLDGKLHELIVQVAQLHNLFVCRLELRNLAKVLSGRRALQEKHKQNNELYK